MPEKNADVNCCFLCSVIFIEYYSTMHCNEVLQVCQVDPIYCNIFGAAERVLRYGLPINLRYIFKRVPALVFSHQKSGGKPKCTKSLVGNQNAPKVCHTVFMLALKFTDIFWSRFVGRWWKGPGPTGPPARSWICRVRGSSSLQTPVESSEVDTCHKIW